MSKSFHLSIGVASIPKSVDFFTNTLPGKVTHEDPSGYVNIELFESQITLKNNPGIKANLPDFHFGFNMSLNEFDHLAENILSSGRQWISMEPKVVDANTPMERKKMYLKSPTGYIVELKGYR